MRKAWVLALVGLLLAACRPDGGALTVSDAWARPAAAGANSAIYLTIHNDGPADELRAAQVEVAGMTQLHRSIIDDQGTVHMEQQPLVELPAGQTVRFEPGGLHIMMMELEHELEEDDNFSLQLTFQDHRPLTLTVPVRSQ